jgi:hypothetical protein
VSARLGRTPQAENTCRIVEGRLMEIHVAAGYNTRGDVDAMMALISQTLARVPESQRVVIAADWRPCKLFTPEVAERAMYMMARDNARIERSAILHRADQATSVLQVMRLIRESRHEHRRVFTSSVLMRGFLDETLTNRESARLKEFVAPLIG